MATIAHEEYKNFVTKEQLAELFGYSSYSSFVNSSSHDRIMCGVNSLLSLVRKQIGEYINSSHPIKRK